MRNKFTELIEQGVASFNYTSIAPEMPEQDMVCRMYNNIFSIPTDTHMSYNAITGERYITGHMIEQTAKWDSFVYAHNWGAVAFKTTGYWCLCDFLQKNVLEGRYSVLNNDVIYLVTPIPAGTEQYGVACPGCPSHCVTTESQMPLNIGMLTVNADPNKVKECYLGKMNLYEVCKAMNESLYVKGSEWTVNGEHIACPIGNKVVIL